MSGLHIGILDFWEMIKNRPTLGSWPTDVLSLFSFDRNCSSRLYVWIANRSNREQLVLLR
jgi:hypothetical protein